MENKKMYILATCQYGWPEPYPSLYPMEEMAKRGHYVNAITGIPNYPMGKIYEGYRHNKVEKEIHEGVHITHVPVIPRKHNKFYRFLNYHSYPLTANIEIQKLEGNYDVIFANQSSPVMMVEPAIKYAKKWNKKVVLYCMDLWPASLEIGGIKKNSLVYKFYYQISKKIYTSADKILVTSRMFKKYFINEFGISADKIEYLPQYAISEFDNIPEQMEKNTTDFVFAGNIGTAQNIYVILKAAYIIQENKITDNGKNIYFHIFGDGQELDNLKKYSQKYHISNVFFYGRRPSEEMPKYYAFADAMLVTLDANPLISLTLPAKVQSYMSAGKPILASANGEIADVVRESGAGLCSNAGDAQEFVNIIQKFVDNENRKAMGERAKKYYDENFSRKKIMDKLEKILIQMSF